MEVYVDGDFTNFDWELTVRRHLAAQRWLETRWTLVTPAASIRRYNCFGASIVSSTRPKLKRNKDPDGQFSHNNSALA